MPLDLAPLLIFFERGSGTLVRIVGAPLKLRQAPSPSDDSGGFELLAGMFRKIHSPDPSTGHDLTLGRSVFHQ